MTLEHYRAISSTLGNQLSRRTLLRFLGVSTGAVAVAPLLAACGDDEDDANAGSNSTSDTVNDDNESEATSTETDSSNDDNDDERTSDAESDERETLVIAVQGLPANLDPFQHLSNVGTRVTYSLFDHLFERDFHDSDPPGSGFGVLPMLSTDWERIDDVTLEVSLRDDVLFHNGDSMTAEDVKFTFDRMLVDPIDEMLDPLGYVSTVSEVEVVDDYTVRFHTAEPDPILENRLTSWATWIIPKAYYEEVGLDEFSLNPVGTGPYRFVELRQDELLVLEAFDDWWGGTPPARRVEFRVIPETAGRVSAVVSGEAQIATNIPPDQVETIEEADGVSNNAVPLANCHVLVYNTFHPSIQDKRIRQAMNLAIDRDLLVETLWSGRAVRMRSHQFEEYGDLFNEDRPYLPYDPDAARSLLEESDYNGELIQFFTAEAYYTLGLDAAQAIVAMWQEIGLNAEVVVSESLSDVMPEDMVVRNWSNSSFTADPDGAFWLRWGAEAWPQTGPGSWPDGASYWTPENPEFNELGLAARETLDQEFRFDAYQTMLDIWEDEAPGTVLYIPTENYAVRDEVNWTPYSFYYMDLRPKNLSFNG